MPTNVLTTTDIRGEFFRKLDASPFAGFVRDLAIDVATPGIQTARYAFLPDAPKPQKLDGTGGLKVTYPNPAKFEIENVAWANAMAFPRFMVENDMTGDTGRKISDLAGAYNYFQWDLIRTLIAAGGSGTGYDGAAFFSGSHAYQGATAQDNDLASGDVAALAVTGSGTPTAEEMVDAIMGVTAHMQGYLDAEGRPMNLAGRRYAVITPKELIGVTRTALNANNLAGGETNVLTADGFSFVHIPAPDLSGGTVFYVARIDDPNRKPFVFQTHTPLELDVLGPGSEHFVKQKEVLAAGYWAGAAGYGEPLMIAKATLS